MGGRSSRARLFPNSPFHLSLLQGRFHVWVLKSWMFLCRIHVWVLISRTYFRYNIPYLLDKPGTGHQVILLLSNWSLIAWQSKQSNCFHYGYDVLRYCYHLQRMFTMINDNQYHHNVPGEGGGVPGGRTNAQPAWHSRGSSNLLQVSTIFIWPLMLFKAFKADHDKHAQS